MYEWLEINLKSHLVRPTLIYDPQNKLVVTLW